MKCDEIRELLSLYIDGMLDEEHIKEMEAHLVNCAACKKEYDEMLEFVRLLNQIEMVPVPEAFELRMKKALKEERENTSAMTAGKGITKKGRWKILTSIAAVFAVGVISLSVFHDVLGILPDKLDGGDQSAAAQPKIAKMDIPENDTSAGAVQEDSRMAASNLAKDSASQMKKTEENNLSNSSADTHDNYTVKKKGGKSAAADVSSSAEMNTPATTYGTINDSSQLNGNEESTPTADSSAAPQALADSNENVGAGNEKRMVPRLQCSRSFAASGVERNVAAVQFYENLIASKLDGFDYQILGSRYLQTGEWQFRVFIFRGKDGNTYNEEITITGKDGDIIVKCSKDFMGL